MEHNILVKWMKLGSISVPKMLMEHYTKIGLTETELVALLHVQAFIEQGDHFPTPELLSVRMTKNPDDCAKMLGSLCKRGYLSLEKDWDEQGIMYEDYSLEPLWIKLFQIIKKQEMEKEVEIEAEEEGKLYQKFEQEFSRPLSPIEAETLSMWLDQDQHKPELIIAALREAVVSGKLNFRYIDRILFEWKRNGVQTLQQAKVYGEKFRKYQQQPKAKEQERVRSDAYPSFNWLES
ncbi:DNA replication protein dnaD [Alkalihalobacillus alcalophilus ATCC 27647 = CGMCC 1.3604]|uniref:DNA replication protein DnaD n=1 Tax=Alkalihalobacillus alcalophilus ATCC 27647 = CGMCC 1.3604 TaxID=1218173 RepID=A0A094WMV9_ALKAL|nr:DnaD domain-containing protein [Alkalihalobacillus alcalophilus]KGA99104.1 DNA replication protein DnaD [Alkalihalobacillus alcalophilus ATCC 27647 = CGMCC 1.3604]MED1563473.1 DnaD domain-containing protein [Alkalihalobacillus alcalophilus]THG90306.1 DNA replication protein dnaD [Alkalihalobacillus alcalophilus ATCC 27647 = CGMCC 1.3604]